jgi:hypothetical protein
MQKLLLSILMFSGAFAAYAKQTYVLKGLHSSADNGVYVELLCGESLSGLFVEDKTTAARIGAVVLKREIMCAGSPQYEQLPSNIRLNGEFLSADFTPRRLTLDDVTNVQVNAQNRLEVSIDENCIPVLGFLLQLNSDNIEVAGARFVGDSKLASENKSLQTCRSSTTTKTINAVEVLQTVVKPMQKPVDVRLIHKLMVQKPNSTLRKADGSLEARIQLPCKRMPVALYAASERRGVGIGVVTAFFPNMPCLTKKLSEYVVSSKMARFKKGTKLYTLEHIPRGDLVLAKPTSFKTDALGVSLTNHSACAQGVAFSMFHENALAIVSTKSCKNRSVTLPVQAMPASEIFALKMP